MLTPKFKLTQNDESVTAVIHAPFGSLKDAEVNVEKSSFTFWAKPYLLKLKLPGNLLAEDEGTSAVFDATTGDFTIQVKKATLGEVFPNLDLITTLKQPKPVPGKESLVGKTLVQLVEKPTGVIDDLLGENVDWNAEPLEDGGELPNLAGLTISNHRYGFADLLCDSLDGLQEELLEICDIKCPHKKSASRRRKERVDWEREHFDEGYYMQDAMETGVISAVITLKTPWEALLPKFLACSNKDEQDRLVDFDDKERDQMMQLANRDYVFDDPVVARSTYLGLVDILFAYVYNFRATGGENDVESPWNISRVSSTLNWFDKFSTLRDVVVACFRRMLCLPQFRHWDLNEKVLDDVVTILSLGKKSVLKCLLSIIATFNSREPYYLLNRLYLSDYAVFIQRIPEIRLQSLADALKETKVTKADVDLGLEACDAACRLALEEAGSDADVDVDDLERSVGRLSVAAGEPSAARATAAASAVAGKGEQLDSDDDDDEDDSGSSSDSASGDSYVMEPCCDAYGNGRDCLCSKWEQGSVSSGSK